MAETFTAGPARFEELSLVSLTGFVAVVLKAEKNGRRATAGFVLNLPVSGMPAQRDQRVLKEIISDPSRFIRYLLLILAEDKQVLGPEFDPQEGDGGESWRCLPGIPLLEEMVRAFSRNPEKIARIQKLLDDLKVSHEGKDVLPTGFVDLWAAFQTAGSSRGTA